MSQQQHTATPEPLLLQIDCGGHRLLLRFRGLVFPNWSDLADCRRAIERLLQEHDVTAVTLDLRDVQVIGTSMLKLLIELRQRGLDVRLTNAAPLVRDVLSITRLDTLFPIVETA